MEQRSFQEIIQQAKENYPMDRTIKNHAMGVNCTTGIEMEEINVIGQINAFTGDVVRVYHRGVSPYDEQIGIVVDTPTGAPMIVSHEWRIPYQEIRACYEAKRDGRIPPFSCEILVHFIEHSSFQPEILTHPKFPPFTFE